MGLVQTIQREAQLIDYMSILPPKEAIMLHDDIRYRTGSDYSTDELKAPLYELTNELHCFFCGRWESVNLTYLIGNKVVCDYCQEKGE